MALEVVIGDEVEATGSFLSAIKDSIASAQTARDVTVVNKPLRNRQGFSRIPEYAQQVQVCLGPRCVMAGAWDIYDELRRQLQSHGLEKNGVQRIIAVKTACLQPCNFAPVFTVQPDNVWYGNLTTSDVTKVVEQHLLQGQPVTGLAYAPGETVRSDVHEADMMEDYPTASAHLADISVVKAFARPAMKIFDAGAAFMQIRNEGQHDDWLIDVCTPCSDTPRIHDASQSHETLLASPFTAILLPAQGAIELQPGQLHMMLFDFKTDMLEGTQIPLTLRFKNAGDLSIQLTMHPPLGGMSGHM